MQQPTKLKSISDNMAQALFNMALHHNCITAHWTEGSISLLVEGALEFELSTEIERITQVAGTPSAQYALGRFVHLFYVVEVD